MQAIPEVVQEAAAARRDGPASGDNLRTLSPASGDNLRLGGTDITSSATDLPSSATSLKPCATSITSSGAGESAGAGGGDTGSSGMGGARRLGATGVPGAVSGITGAISGSVSVSDADSLPPDSADPHGVRVTDSRGNALGDGEEGAVEEGVPARGAEGADSDVPAAAQQTRLTSIVAAHTRLTSSIVESDVPGASTAELTTRGQASNDPPPIENDAAADHARAVSVDNGSSNGSSTPTARIHVEDEASARLHGEASNDPPPIDNETATTARTYAEGGATARIHGEDGASARLHGEGSAAALLEEATSQQVLPTMSTWKREFKLPWREAGPPHHLDDKVDSDQ